MRRGHRGGKGEDDQEKPEKASRYTEAEDEQSDKLFLQGGIHNGGKGLYRGVGIAINSSSENVAGQVVERVVRKQTQGKDEVADVKEESKKRDVC